MTGGKEGGREIKPESHDLESPRVRVAAWGTASPLTDGPTGQSWPRAGSHGRWKRLLWQSGTDFHGDREILVGGGGFPVAVPWLPEPEPRVDGRAGGGGGPPGAAFTVQEACPPPRSSPTEGGSPPPPRARAPEPCGCCRWKSKLRPWDGLAGRPAGTHQVHRPCGPVGGACGQHRGHRAASRN